MPALERRPLDLKTFEELTADVARLRSAGYDKAGQWSLEQVLDHLERTMTTALDPRGMPRPVRWLLRPVARRLVRTRRMPRLPAPPSIRPPKEVEGDVHTRFADVVKRAAAIPGEAIDHPAFGWISVSDWQQLQLVHASRHLSFLLPRTA